MSAAGKDPAGYSRELLDLLARLRTLHGNPSYRAVAARIPSLKGKGTSAGYISEILNGRKVPTGDMAAAIARALRANPREQERARHYAEAAREGRAPAQPNEDAAAVWRIEPFTADAPQVSSDTAPSVLLSAHYRVVEFTGRGEDLRKLTDWRDAPRTGLAVRLLHASGGQGKTRLAARLAQLSMAMGWVVGSGRHQSGAASTGRSLSPRRISHTAGLLLVADYAERWPVGDLIEFIVAQGQSKAYRDLPVRILLLARPAGGWWQGVRAALVKYAITADEMELAPLATTSTDRYAVFTTARDCFAKALGVSAAKAASPPARLYNDREFNRVLTAHMAALAAVHAIGRGDETPQDPVQISRYLLDRERQHWQKMYGKSKRDDAADDEAVSAISPAVMARVVYTATLTRPLSYADGVSVLDRMGISAMANTADQALMSHAACYPPADAARVLEPLYPDRLGEDFLALQSPGHQIGGYTPDPWAEQAIAALLQMDSGDQTPPWVPTAVAVLTEAASRWPHLARNHLYPSLRKDPRLAFAGGGAALSALAQIAPIDVLEAVEACIPTERIHLTLGIAAIVERLTVDRLARTNDPAERGELYWDLGGRFAEAGLHAQALTAAEHALNIYRNLAKADPDEHMPDVIILMKTVSERLYRMGRLEEALDSAQKALIAALLWEDLNGYPLAMTHLIVSLQSTIAGILRDTGQLEESLSHINRAVDLARILKAADAGESPADLARRLANQSAAHLSAGRLDEALKTAREAVEIYRQLQVGSIHDDPDLAKAVMNLGLALVSLGNMPDEALACAREALQIYRQLAEQNPVAFDPELAHALSNNAAVLTWQHRFPDEALRHALEAVEIYRRLADQNALTFEPGLASALVNASTNLMDAGHTEQGLTAIREAIALSRRLASADPTAHELLLARSLSTFGNHLAATGRTEEAVTAAQDAVAILRRLALANAAAHEQDLAIALTNLGRHNASLGQAEEALAAQGEVVTIYRRLARRYPTAHQPRLAEALGTLGHGLAMMNQDQHALDVLQEAVVLRRQLAKAGPAAHKLNLALALTNLSAQLMITGRAEQAATTSEEAIAIYRQSADLNTPERLARALANLGAQLVIVGRAEEAVAAAEEAVALSRRLAEADPGKSAADLGKYLANLQRVLSRLGNHESALAAAQEAVSVYQQIDHVYTNTYIFDLAAAVFSLGAQLMTVGRTEDAVATTEEAVVLFRRLVRSDSAAHEPHLARALVNLGAHLLTAGRAVDAVAATREAVTLYRRLTQANPDMFASDLGESLINLRTMLSQLGRHESSLSAAEDVVSAYRLLDGSCPADRPPGLAQALATLGYQLAAAGRTEEAIAATGEAVDLFRALANADPAVHEPHLAHALTSLCSHLLAVGRAGEAVAAADEAVGLFRRLGEADPEIFNVEIARGLWRSAYIRAAEKTELPKALKDARESVALYQRLTHELPAELTAELKGAAVTLADVLDSLSRAEEATQMRNQFGAGSD